MPNLRPILMDLIHPTIIIVTGRPAAGKSTLAKWLSQELGKASVDMMFYFAQAELEVGHSMIMDNSFYPRLQSKISGT